MVLSYFQAALWLVRRMEVSRQLNRRSTPTPMPKNQASEVTADTINGEIQGLSLLVNHLTANSVLLLDVAGDSTIKALEPTLPADSQYHT